MWSIKNITVSIFVACILSTGILSAATYEWKFQTSAQAGDNFFNMEKKWAENIRIMSNNKIHIKIFPVNKIVRYNETLEAISSNFLQGHITSTSYFSGKDPAFAMLGDLIGAYDHPFQMQKFLEYGGGNELFRELLAPYGLYFIGAAWTGKESLISTKPIRQLADFKGVRIRSPEGLAQEVFRAVGAVPINLSTSETYSAIKMGIVDAADYTVFSTNHELGFHEYAKYPIYPGIHSMPVVEISMNLKIWKKLPEDIKLIMTMATRDLAREMVQRLEVLDTIALAEAKQQGIEIIKWNAGERRKFRMIAQTQWKRWSNRSRMAKKVYETVITYLKSQGIL